MPMQLIENTTSAPRFVQGAWLLPGESRLVEVGPAAGTPSLSPIYQDPVTKKVYDAKGQEITSLVSGAGSLNPAAATTATLGSPVDKNADTSRTRYVSYQKQEAANNYNGGEPIWLDTAPLAKSMITWRLPVNRSTRQVLSDSARPYADSDWLRTVWVARTGLRKISQTTTIQPMFTATGPSRFLTRIWPCALVSASTSSTPTTPPKSAAIRRWLRSARQISAWATVVSF